MKKICRLTLIILMVLAINVKAIELPKQTDHEKVTIYIFRGHNCTHCYDFLKYFKKNYSKYADYFEIKAYEVWKNTENKKLMDAVIEYKEDDANGVPYIVIGNNYAVDGFKDSMADEIIETALDEYKNDNYRDIVKKTAKDYENVEIETFEEALIAEGLKTTPKDAAITFTIIFVAVAGGLFLIKKSKK